jgi:hypothetical protein
MLLHTRLWLHHLLCTGLASLQPKAQQQQQQHMRRQRRPLPMQHLTQQQQQQQGVTAQVSPSFWVQTALLLWYRSAR